MPDAGIVAPDGGRSVLQRLLAFAKPPEHRKRLACRRQSRELDPHKRLARDIPLVHFVRKKIAVGIDKRHLLAFRVGLAVVKPYHALFRNPHDDGEVRHRGSEALHKDIHMVVVYLPGVVPHRERCNRLCRCPAIGRGNSRPNDPVARYGYFRRGCKPGRHQRFARAKAILKLNCLAAIRRTEDGRIGLGTDSPALKREPCNRIRRGSYRPCALIRIGRLRIAVPDVVHRAIIAKKLERKLVGATGYRVRLAGRQFIASVVKRREALLFSAVVDKPRIRHRPRNDNWGNRPRPLDIASGIIGPLRIYRIIQANGISIRSAVRRVRHARCAKGAILGAVLSISNADLVCPVIDKTRSRHRLFNQALDDFPLHFTRFAATIVLPHKISARLYKE